MGEGPKLIFMVADDPGWFDLGGDGGHEAPFGPVLPQLDAMAASGLRFTQRCANALNGGGRFSGNGPLVGGFRAPCTVHRRAVVGPGDVSEQRRLTTGGSATLRDTAGVATDAACPQRSVSLRPVLRDASTTFERPLHGRMSLRGQSAHRHGRWQSQRVDGHDDWLDTDDGAREQAHRSAIEPERLGPMREAWLALNAPLPPIPDDATVSLGRSVKDMPQR